MAHQKTIYSGRLIQLNQETIDLPDGRTTTLDIVRHPGGAVIAPLNERDELCLLKQFRYAAGGYIWELPAGCIDAGEAPLDTAKRELGEECGLAATDWVSLGSIYPSPGFCDEVLHLFLARGLSNTEMNRDADEFIEPHWISRTEVLSMASAGEIDDSKSLALLLRMQQYLDGRKN